jgi:probable O-glycosylation ligase (exosortase A-associated)
MGIRDAIVFVLVFGGLPLMLRYPAAGIMYWAWIGLMNPHRQAFGIAFEFPFAQVVAIATLIGLLFTNEPRRFKGGAAACILVLFMVWTWVTTSTALVPEAAWAMLDRVFKIQLFTLVALLVLYKRQHVLWLAGTLVISIGYYGVKGGLFTLVTAGNSRVWGPEGTFIYDNNSLGVANVMSIPLWVFFYVMAERPWMKLAILGCIALTAVAVFGSHSRGALLAISTMALFLWLKSPRKVLVGIVLGFLAVTIISFMPSKWEERMGTMATYEDDGSAMGRIDAWRMLYNLAVDRPVVGGGFEPYTNEVYQRYNPNFDKPQVAHSIYFQVLGEHGFVGLAIWLLFWLLTWRMCRQVIVRTRDRPDDAWANWLARMVQVSLVGYFVGGAFLNLAYWDMPYYLMVLMAVTRYSLAPPKEQESGAPEPHPQPEGEGAQPDAG